MRAPFILLAVLGLAPVSAPPAARAPAAEEAVAGVSGVVGGVAYLPPARVRFELHRGQRQLEQGVFPEAAASFERVTQAAPQHPAGWFLLSRALAGQGQATAARDAASKAVALVEAMPPEVRRAFDVASFHFNLGLLQVTTVDLEGAEDSFRKALAARPGEPRIRYQLASLLLQRGRDREAGAELEAVVAARPDLALAWLALGKARLRLGDAASAEKALLEAARLAPDDDEVQFALSSVYRATGDTGKQEAALAAFERLRTASEDAERARQAVESKLREASAAMGEGKWATAATTLAPLLEEPVVKEEGFHLTRVLVDLARAKQQQGEFLDARRLYRQAVARDPKSFLARFELGTLLAQEGLLDAAAPQLLAATELNPFDYAAHVNLGLAMAGLGRLNDALAEVRKAATIQPEQDAVRQLLVNLEWSVGHENVARAVASLGGVTLPEGGTTKEAASQREPVPAGEGRKDLPWMK